MGPKAIADHYVVNVLDGIVALISAPSSRSPTWSASRRRRGNAVT